MLGGGGYLFVYLRDIWSAAGRSTSASTGSTTIGANLASAPSAFVAGAACFDAYPAGETVSLLLKQMLLLRHLCPALALAFGFAFQSGSGTIIARGC
jgi:hypothetical protein